MQGAEAKGKAMHALGWSKNLTEYPTKSLSGILRDVQEDRDVWAKHHIFTKKKEERSCVPLSCGQRWIRTTEVERQQIYSLPHLATLEFAQTPLLRKAMQRYNFFFNLQAVSSLFFEHLS